MKYVMKVSFSLHVLEIYSTYTRTGIIIIRIVGIA